MLKWVRALLLPVMVLMATPVGAQVVINEIDYDQVGTDTAEFLELKNTGASAVNLDDYTVELVNGTGGGAAVYDTINLPNVNLAAGDYYVICANAATVVNCDLDDGPDTDFIQNGSPDAVGLRLSGVLVDAVSYEGNSGTPYTETTGVANVAASSDSNSVAFIGLSRFADGADTNNNSVDLSIRCITPGVVNTSATTGCTAPPVLPNLTINDVSANETASGTTTFTFTVSLSAAAGAGGVTFDIATADGTAQDDNPAATEDNDYVARSLTGQTIASGSSTYTFDVSVNGDTAIEPNETFFVNVTNVTGANVTDGQGQGTIVNDDAPNLTVTDVTPTSEGNAGTTTFSFTVNLSSPAGAGGVTFDIATADGTAQDDTPTTEDNDYVAKSLTSQTISPGNSSYTFDVLVNGDATPEGDETFFVNVTSIVGAVGVDAQGQGTIVNDDFTKIHTVQGSGAATPVPATTVSVEGIVVANFQGSTKLQGFFLQEEDADVDANPATSEGIFVFCNTCPTAVAEGDKVRVTGSVSEFFSMTEITASTAGSVVVVSTGNPLPTASSIDLPVVGDVNAYYEAREGMRVAFVDTLTVSEYFELFRYGQIELYEGGRPRQFTEQSLPNVAGLTAHLDNLARRRVILDDDDDTQNVPLTLTNGQQFVFHPQANGGFSAGTQGTDFFRGGDLVNGLTGVLHWSFSGQSGTDAWRIRPAAATPATFTVANPRPATPPAVGGAIKAVGMNLLNYFTTIDTMSSSSSGPCAPAADQDCRGADSVAELNRQRERASVVVCSLNADVYAFMELENTTASASITDLLGAVNARCGGAHPYAFVNTGGTLGTDAIRVQQIYRTGILSPVGSPLSDLDPIHNRPPTAQTFDVVDAMNPAFGQRFTVVANHFKSKGCPGTGADADAGDGAGCFNGTRTAQATRLLTWIASSVLPAAGDPDVLLLGDFNAYAKETPVTTLTGGGFTDLEAALLGPSAYSYLFDGQLGHLDYAFSNASLTPQIAGVGTWHINADEVPLFDYNDEIKDTGESAFEEKPDGSSLVPTRNVFEAATPYRASDHDPVLVGLFPVADLSLTKLDTPDPVTTGSPLAYTVTVGNAGPNTASDVSWTDTVPAGTTFVSLSTVAGWTCTTPSAGSGGTVSCSKTSLDVGTAVFTLTVLVNPALLSGPISNSATVTSSTPDTATGNESATQTTSVIVLPYPHLTLTKTTTTSSFSAAGDVISYALVASNTGNMLLTNVRISDPLIPTLSCTPAQPATLPPGAALTCIGSHVVTPGDVVAGFVTNTASASGDAEVTTLDTLFALPEARVTVTAQGTVTVLGVAPGIGETRLALAACTVELQQDWTPRYTKLQFEVWNEDEVKFTGAAECANSWHETDFGTTFDAARQNFTVAVLGTYGARYRVQAVASTVCPGSQPTGLLGVQSMFAGPNLKAVGTPLTGAGKISGRITWDPAGTVPEGAIR